MQEHNNTSASPFSKWINGGLQHVPHMNHGVTPPHITYSQVFGVDGGIWKDRHRTAVLLEINVDFFNLLM